MTTSNSKQVDFASSIARRLIGGLNSVIRGRNDTVKLVITALLADGHALLEDYPGSGKTTLAKTLGKLITKNASLDNDPILPFRRIQFTPDLLPGDVLGVNIFDPKTGSFRFLHGPVFAHVVLADEINRTGPKVQAAFLECMAEKQVTIDNMTYPLDDLFFVLGTQNPLDIAGTYPLPIVQLDRFLLKIPMTYVDSATELEILQQHDTISDRVVNIEPVCTRNDIISARSLIKEISIKPEILKAIVSIVQSTRNNKLIQYGASTRSAIMFQSALKAWAVVEGRDYVTEDDLKFIAPYVLSHRLKFHSGAGDSKQALNELIRPHMETLIRSSF